MAVMSLKKSVLPATLTLFAGFAAQANDPRKPDPAYIAAIDPAEGEVAFDFKLSGYVFGLKMVSARYRVNLSDNSYTIYSDMKTSGLAAMLKKQQLWSYTDGTYDDTDMKPVNHIQQNMNKKSRRVEIFYNYKRDRIRQTVNPRFGSMGTPPATPEQAFTSDDANTAMLKVLMSGHRMKDEICTETIPVYDGKQHYNLRMVRQADTTKKFEGTKYPAIECHVYADPISGFDPEDLPDAEEKSKPVKVYFINKPEYGIYMPVRLTYKVGGFSAVVKVKDAKFASGS